MSFLVIMSVSCSATQWCFEINMKYNHKNFASREKRTSSNPLFDISDLLPGCKGMRSIHVAVHEWKFGQASCGCFGQVLRTFIYLSSSYVCSIDLRILIRHSVQICYDFRIVNWPACKQAYLGRKAASQIAERPAAKSISLAYCDRETQT